MGQIAFFTVGEQGKLERLKTHDGWPSRWTHVIPGNFGKSDYTDLLFYDSRKGDAEFYFSDGKGNLARKGSGIRGGWKIGWSHIIPGNFGGGSLTDLLFYDESSGDTAIYLNTGDASLSLKRSQKADKAGQKTEWSQIIPGNFAGDSLTDLLYYNKQDGSFSFYVNNGEGLMKELKGVSKGKWEAGLHIIPGNFSGGTLSDLILYDPYQGIAKFYENSGGAKMRPIQTLEVGLWGQWLQSIIPGNFGGKSLADLLIYKRSDGSARFYTNSGGARMGNPKSIKAGGWRKTWNHIIPGHFSDSEYSDLLFYDQPLAKGQINYRIASCPNDDRACVHEKMEDHTPPTGYATWTNPLAAVLVQKNEGADIESIQATVSDDFSTVEVSPSLILSPKKHAIVDSSYWAIVINYHDDLSKKGLGLRVRQEWVVSVEISWKDSKEKLSVRLSIAS